MLEKPLFAVFVRVVGVCVFVNSVCGCEILVFGVVCVLFLLRISKKGLVGLTKPVFALFVPLVGVSVLLNSVCGCEIMVFGTVCVLVLFGVSKKGFEFFLDFVQQLSKLL